MLSRLLPGLLVFLGLLTIACDERSDASSGDDGAGAIDLPGDVYVALGDSIAAGTGATDGGYPARVAEELGDIELESLAVPGHTTQDLIDHQLAPALDLLESRDVGLVTLTIGGNDLFQYAADADCVEDPADEDCPLRRGLTQVEQRLDLVLRRLREADGDAVIVVQLYPNLFSGTGHMFERQADTAFALLNDVIAETARRHDAVLADPRAAFRGRGDELSHLLDPTPDAHPNDAGYEAIAAAFLQALRMAQ